ncbi:nucleotidyltransferase family protein [Sphingomonas sp. GM_Shp_1]|uniref:nucleotidyltransferase family protein n=1 Tax=Sphingomonas sp. GM_Shp_1 TaxID=2937381 RepID=UPI00226BAB3E|nr:nucleotidyltransferase family protein [Sphingomonas sp. GM_Shp_1]
MIDAEDVVLVLLAAGRSSRFGMDNKLEAEFLGKPVGFHVTTALESIAFADRIVVTDGCRLDFASRGYRPIHNADVGQGLSHSLQLGVREAMKTSPRAILVALADMPRVTAAHIYRLFDAFEGPDAVVVSSNGEHPTPPGIFGSGRFEALLKLEGDEGARALVAGGRHVVTAPAELIDIDTPEDLERLRQLVHAPERKITRGGAHRSD